MENIQDTSFGKMSPERSLPTKGRTSDAYLRALQKSKTMKPMYLNLRNGNILGSSWEMGIPSHGDFLMHSFGECPKEENVSFLSQILEENPPEKYSLSQKACRGILRRASERGKELPLELTKALEKQASTA